MPGTPHRRKHEVASGRHGGPGAKQIQHIECTTTTITGNTGYISLNFTQFQPQSPSL
eukprot:m.1101044 g.1101044  ORF g.1101044 m.1101044 type:complete len:57 (-) comp24322_c0_seq6:3675-3845(-)